jgi:hypothetical protein
MIRTKVLFVDRQCLPKQTFRFGKLAAAFERGPASRQISRFGYDVIRPGDRYRQQHQQHQCRSRPVHRRRSQKAA